MVYMDEWEHDILIAKGILKIDKDPDSKKEDEEEGEEDGQR